MGRDWRLCACLAGGACPRASICRAQAHLRGGPHTRRQCEQGCARRLARGRQCARGARGASEGGGAEGDLGARARGGWAARGHPLMGRFPAVRAEDRGGSRRGGDCSDAELLLLMPLDVWRRSPAGMPRLAGTVAARSSSIICDASHYVGGVFFCFYKNWFSGWASAVKSTDIRARSNSRSVVSARK